MSLVQIMTTADDRTCLEVLARKLLAERLVACAQIEGPVESHYRWRGTIESSSEWRCILKTRSALTDAVVAAVEAQHPYEVPEVLVVPVVHASEAYADWVVREASAEGGQA